MLYNITDTLTNKVYQYDGERPPTQEELSSLIGPSPETLQAAKTLQSQDLGSVNPEAISPENSSTDPRQTALLNQKKKLNQQQSQPNELLPSGIAL